jgi:hypothetical protein
MARGRFINTSIATDTKLNSLSIEAHWLYMMTIPHLDRDGLIIADTYVLFGKVCPRRPEVISRIDALIAEWVACGLVTTYSTDDGIVAYFHGFAKNQQGMTYSREGASVLQAPPGYTRTNSGLTQDELMSNSCNGRAEVKYEYEYKDQEGESAHVASPEPTNKVIRHKSPHLDLRHFTDGYIPEGTGSNAVEVYYERFSINQDAARLNSVKEDDLCRLCTDLDKLRDVVTAYSRTSYQAGNVQLILDWYTTGVPDKNKTPGQARNGALDEDKKAALRTAASLARKSIESAQKFKTAIDPAWAATIEKAKVAGVI